MGAPSLAKACTLGQAIDDLSGSLEERVARLSINIGARVARADDDRDREMILMNARGKIVEELIEQGHPVHDAAIIADDIINAARKLVSELVAHSNSHR